MRKSLLLIAGLCVAGLPGAAQDLLGHGGPVGTLDVRDGRLISGSLDARAIVWDLATARAEHVVRFHAGNVTGAALLNDGGFVTAGQDGRIALWQGDDQSPVFATSEGSSSVAVLDVSPDGAIVAAGFRSGEVMLLDVAAQSAQVFSAHADRVTGLGFLNAGTFFTVGSDLRLAKWGTDAALHLRTDLPDLPNGLAIMRDRAAVIFAEGAVRLYSDAGALLPERFLTDRPLISITADADGLATAAIDGTVWMLNTDDLSPRLSFQGATGPVWSLALTADAVFTAGATGAIRRWSRADGQALGDTADNAAMEYTDDSRGAEIWASCSVCHSLQPDDHDRAGPSLHGILGREIASQEGYSYSEALRDLDIVWTARTISELFEFGPDAYTPGSRMPDQYIGDPADRAALVEFLERASEAHPVAPEP